MVAALRRNSDFKVATSPTGKVGFLPTDHAKDMPRESETLAEVVRAAQGRGWKRVSPEVSAELLLGDLPDKVRRRRIRCLRGMQGFLRCYEDEIKRELTEKVGSSSRQQGSGASPTVLSDVILALRELCDEAVLSDPTSFLDKERDRRYFHFNGIYSMLLQRHAGYGPFKQQALEAVQRHPDFLTATSERGKLGILPKVHDSELPRESEAIAKVSDFLFGQGLASWPPLGSWGPDDVEELFEALPKTVKKRRIQSSKGLHAFLTCYGDTVDVILRAKALELSPQTGVAPDSPLDKALFNILNSAAPTAENSRIKFDSNAKEGRLFFKISWIMAKLPVPRTSSAPLRSNTALTQYLREHPDFLVNQNCVHIKSLVTQMATEQEVERQLMAVLQNGNGMTADEVISKLNKQARMRIKSKRFLLHFCGTPNGCSFRMENGMVFKKETTREKNEEVQESTVVVASPTSPTDKVARVVDLHRGGFALIQDRNQSKVVVSALHFFLWGVRTTPEMFTKVVQVGDQIHYVKGPVKSPVWGCSEVAVQAWMGTKPASLPTTSEAAQIWDRWTMLQKLKSLEASVSARVESVQGDFAILQVSGGKALMYRPFFTHNESNNLTREDFSGRLLNPGKFVLFVMLVRHKFDQFLYVVKHGWTGKKQAFPTIQENAESATSREWNKQLQPGTEVPDIPASALSSSVSGDIDSSENLSNLVAKVEYIRGNFAILNISKKGKALMHRKFFTYDDSANMSQEDFEKSLGKDGSKQLFVQLVLYQFDEFSFIVQHGWKGKRMKDFVPRNPAHVTIAQWKCYKKGGGDNDVSAELSQGASSRSGTPSSSAKSRQPSEESEVTKTDELCGHVIEICRIRGFAVLRNNEHHTVLVHKSRLFLNGSKIENCGGGFNSNVHVGDQVGFVALPVSEEVCGCYFVAGRAWIGEKPPIAEKQNVEGIVKMLQSSPGEERGTPEGDEGASVDASDDQFGYVSQIISKRKGCAVLKDVKGRHVFIHRSKLFLDGQLIGDGFNDNVHVGTKVGFIPVRIQEDGGGGGGGAITYWGDPAWIGKKPFTSEKSPLKTREEAQAVLVEALESFSPDDVLEGEVLDLSEDFAQMTAVRDGLSLGTAVVHRNQVTCGGGTGLARSRFPIFVKKGISMEFQAVKTHGLPGGTTFVAWSAWIAGSEDWPGRTFEEDDERVTKEIGRIWKEQADQEKAAHTEEAVVKPDPPSPIGHGAETAGVAAKVESVRGDFAVLAIPKRGKALLHRRFFTHGEEADVSQQSFFQYLTAQGSLFVHLTECTWREFSFVVRHGWTGKRKASPVFEGCPKNYTIAMAQKMDYESQVKEFARIQEAAGRRIHLGVKLKDADARLEKFCTKDLALISLNRSFSKEVVDGRPRALLLFHRVTYVTQEGRRPSPEEFHKRIASGLCFKFVLAESSLTEVDFVVVSSGSVLTPPLLFPSPGMDIITFTERAWGEAGQKCLAVTPTALKKADPVIEMSSSDSSNVAAEGKMAKNKDPFNHGRVIQVLGPDFALLYVRGKGRVLVCRTVVTKRNQASISKAQFKEIISLGALVTMYVRQLSRDSIDKLGIYYVASHAFCGEMKAKPTMKDPVNHVLMLWKKFYEEALDIEAPEVIREMGLLKPGFSPFFPCQAFVRKLLTKVVRGGEDFIVLDHHVSTLRPQMFSAEKDNVIPTLAKPTPAMTSAFLNLVLPTSKVDVFGNDPRLLRPFLHCGVPEFSVNSAGDLMAKGLKGYCVGKGGRASFVEVAIFSPDNVIHKLLISPATIKVR